jgi:SRSO17 transposase
MNKRYAIAKDAVFEDCLVTPGAYEGVLERLDNFATPFFKHLSTRMQREKALAYIKGLLSDTERKNVESIAYFHGEDRQPLQLFIGQVDWDDNAILDELVDQVVQEIGSQNGILVLDPTSFAKKGKMSVGVERQWCGRYGKLDNCQVAIFLAYVASGEFMLIDRQLYLPQSWIDDPVRCRNAGVPQERIVMKTRHVQATEMLSGRGRKFPHKWVAGDDEIGKVPWFRRGLRDLNEPYMLAVPSNILICDLEASVEICKDCGQSHERPFINVRDWAKRLPKSRWTKVKVREGHKGWLTLKLVKCRVLAMIENEIGDEETLIVSQWREETGDIRYDYYLSWGNANSDLEEYGRVIKDAYRIEECFRRAKGECGLADYQVRNWRGWHHHVTLSMLSLWFLVNEVRRQKKAYR